MDLIKNGTFLTMNDLYEAYTGQQVTIYIKGGFVFDGILQEYTGTIIKLVDNREKNHYIFTSNIVSIASNI